MSQCNPSLKIPNTTNMAPIVRRISVNDTTKLSNRTFDFMNSSFPRPFLGYAYYLVLHSRHGYVKKVFGDGLRPQFSWIRFILQSQRDCGMRPRVGAKRLPWVIAP